MKKESKFKQKDIYWQDLSPKLSSLSKKQVVELINDYCFSDKNISDIIKKFNMQKQISPYTLVQAFPSIILEHCPYDGEPMVVNIISRSMRSHYHGVLEIGYQGAECVKCEHTQYKCNCQRCSRPLFNRVLDKYNPKQKLQINFVEDQFDLGSLFLFYAIVCCYEDKENPNILNVYKKYYGNPTKTRMNELSATSTQDYDLNLIEELLQAGFIAIDPESQEYAFNRVQNRFSKDSAYFDLNIYDGDKQLTVPEVKKSLHQIFRRYFDPAKVSLETRSKNIAPIMATFNIHSLYNLTENVLNPIIAKDTQNFYTLNPLDPSYLSSALTNYVYHYSLGQLVDIMINSTINFNIKDLMHKSYELAKKNLKIEDEDTDLFGNAELEGEIYHIFNVRYSSQLEYNLSVNYDKNKSYQPVTNYFPTVEMLSSWENKLLFDEVFYLTPASVNNVFWQLIPRKDDIAKYLGEITEE